MNRFVFLLIVSACGGTVTNDDAGVDAGDAASNDPCTPGTCRPQGDPTSACLPPGGPIGQPDAATLGGCCACGSDGFCSSPCVCASPDTPIATPFGDRPIASIAVGDLVLSVDHGVVVTVPVVRTKRTPVHDHRVIEVVVAGGAVLHVSAGHPTADGRWFGDLRPGDSLGGVDVIAARVVPYVHDATYDILPASDTGAYFAAGALIGSTLSAERPRVAASFAAWAHELDVTRKECKSR
jgi:hypothetical protein